MIVKFPLDFVVFTIAFTWCILTLDLLICTVLFLQYGVIFSGLVLDPHPHAAADHVTDAGPGHVTAAGQGRARGQGGSDGEVREKCDSDQRL